MKPHELRLTVRWVDVGPDDVNALAEAIDALPAYGYDDLRHRLTNLSDRVQRMVLTALPGHSPVLPPEQE